VVFAPTAEVVVRPGGVRQRKQIHDLARDRIDPFGRDRVVQKRQACERVAHGAGEDALALEGGRTTDGRMTPCVSRVASTSPKKNALPRTIGPPRLPPKSFLAVVRLRRALPDRVEVVRVELAFRRNSYPVPWNTFVPDFVVTLMRRPATGRTRPSTRSSRP